VIGGPISSNIRAIETVIRAIMRTMVHRFTKESGLTRD
jgi:hypothetical protein